MGVSLVVFGLIGTVVDNAKAVHDCFAETMFAAGLTCDEESIRSVMGRSRLEAIRDLMEWEGETPTRRQLENIRLDFQKRMIQYYRKNPEVREVPGASEAFRKLRAMGIKVGIETGFDRATLQPIIRRLKWTNLIDASVASDEVLRCRPNPDMIHKLMRITNVTESSQVVKVGDTPLDMEEGMSARCGLCIGVATGSGSTESLERIPFVEMLPSVREVPGYIRSIPSFGPYALAPASLIAASNAAKANSASS